MRIENLTQPPYETSLMGVVKGVCDHYGENLAKTADKEMPTDEQVAILEAAAKDERVAVGEIPAIIEAL